MPVILASQNPAALEAGLKAAQGMSPLIYAANAQNWEALGGLGRAVQGSAGHHAIRATWAPWPTLTTKLDGKGVKDLVLDPGDAGLGWGPLRPAPSCAAWP